MRRIFDLSAKGLLRSRVGLAVVMFVLVLCVIGMARTFSGNENDPGPVLQPDDPTATISAPSPGPAASEDGVVVPPVAPTPKTSPGGAKPEAVGHAFASAWVDHQDVSAKEWYEALLPHATRRLADQLKGVDPASVPADRLTGDLVVVAYADSLVDVTIPVDSGRLRLRLSSPEGRWLVDGVDWERA